VSDTGTLVFASPDATANRRALVWIDRQGKEEPLALPPGRYQYPRISPDGRRVAIDVPGANRDIWIWNFQRPSLTRLTDGPTEDLLPAWTPDGSRVFFGSNRAGNLNIYSQAADGSSPARLEFASPGSHVPTSFAPDGKRLLVVDNFKELVALDLSRPDRLIPLLHGDPNYWLGVVSPDGKWLAYESDESGNQVEIFLRPFPDVSGRREKVSLDGGRYPLWGLKGSDELFYVDPRGAMMAASVRLSPDLHLGRVTKLFDWQKPPRGISGRPYDISPVDGRFLMTKPVVPDANASIDVSVVLNWTTELARLMATR
jgi:serine/threonine-protein kinase